MTRDTGLKLAALLCIAAVAFAMLTARQSPSTGYELSLYSSTPVSVWLLLFAGLAGGIGIVVHELATGRYQESRTYLIGFAVVLLSATAFLSVPFIRGYATWRADQMGHLGFVQDISLTGHVGSYNPYPIVHVLFYQIASITGISSVTVVNLNTVLIFPVFVLVMYLLASVILPTRRQQLLAAVIAAGAMTGISRYYLVPNTWSLLLLPLLLYCYFRKGLLPFKLLLMMLLAVYPLLHPLSSLMIIGTLAAIELPKPLYRFLLQRLGMPVPDWIASRPVLWPLALEIAVFLPWVFTREAFSTNRLQLWDQLTGGYGAGEISRIGGALSKVDVHGLDLIILMAKMYGELLIFGALAVIGILVLVRQLRSGEGDDGRYQLLAIGGLFLVGCIGYAAFLLGIPGLEAVGGDRILMYTEMAALPAAAFALGCGMGAGLSFVVSRRRSSAAVNSCPECQYPMTDIISQQIGPGVMQVCPACSTPYATHSGSPRLDDSGGGESLRMNFKTLSGAAVLGLMLLVLTLTFLGHYQSPWIMRPNDQTTETSMTGMAWFLDEKVPAIETVYIASTPKRFAEATIGATATHFRTDVTYDTQFPDHFGYQRYSTVGEEIPGGMYATIHEYDRVVYQTVWRSVGRFNDTDFQRLEDDPSTSRIYSNGGMDCLYLR
ncbi:MAG: hypothetical protein FJ020_05445 [Chloroflexi bacterium]|nr:hypothetical protein [Chloroflexota bacterium]